MNKIEIKPYSGYAFVYIDGELQSNIKEMEISFDTEEDGESVSIGLEYSNGELKHFDTEEIGDIILPHKEGIRIERKDGKISITNENIPIKGVQSAQVTFNVEDAGLYYVSLDAYTIVSGSE